MRSPTPSEQNTENLPQGSSELLAFLTSTRVKVFLAVCCIVSIMLCIFLKEHGGKYGMALFCFLMICLMFYARHYIGNYKPKKSE